jgi:hypothetical protein
MNANQKTPTRIVPATFEPIDFRANVLPCSTQSS